MCLLTGPTIAGERCLTYRGSSAPVYKAGHTTVQPHKGSQQIV